ncbi:divalent-cation tolerance protein CutA [Hansschlegelia plantiphila]|uniref:Divalent cation tolerance protein n=1 Tax=Hansschlegelia plantiphila TaxID=374655 RepID=A0A9W6IZD4_9HYPH|nr:divalent-cation tolerance protein CutA [Hansschlegelia plantiphila]GLK66634.1 divalent cation tolerance protein [Hansschlegelia plantiphila]
MPDFVAVFTTTDDHAVADAIATAVIERREAACARISRAESVYRWDGEIRRTEEFVVEIKTTAAASPAVERTIRRLHAYDLPEILVLPIIGGSESYLAWLAAEVGEANA